MSPLGPGTSRLGCQNNRRDAVKRLAKQVEGRFMREQLNAIGKDKSFDAASKKINERKRSTTIGKPLQRPTSLVRPNATPVQFAKQNIKTNS